MKKLPRYAFYMTCCAILLTQPCSAYLDPASTSYIIQIVVGIVIACGTALGIFWTRLKRVFKRRKNDTEQQLPQDDNEDPDSREEGAKIITADDLLDDDD